MPQAAYKWPNQKLFRAAGAKGSIIKEKNFMCLNNNNNNSSNNNKPSPSHLYSYGWYKSQS